MMVGALSTETYDPDVGKHREMSKAITSKNYPIKYANVRRLAPRVTTLSPDASDNKAPACLRESYNWTSVGRYKAMTDESGKVGRSHTIAPGSRSMSMHGTFKQSEKYPRFAGESAEAQLKKLFAEQMKTRERAKLDGTPLSERRATQKKAIEDA